MDDPLSERPGRGDDVSAELPEILTSLSEARVELTKFITAYQFAIQEIETKVRILQQEFQQLHRYNPIEHVSSRLKSMESIIAKARKTGCGPSLDELRREIRDIAGVRVVCSFTPDVYRIQELLCRQSDVRLLQVKDYIASPKPSGYRSLHAIVEIPVFLSDGSVQVPVEMQFRTSAQDFWASLEHKIFYKYDHEVPAEIAQGLRDAADAASHLDAEMERLSVAIQDLTGEEPPGSMTVTPGDVDDFLALVRESRAGRGRPGPDVAGPSA
ncbi:GTP pyrophosphokinase [Arsenicicoccus sp. UBA7492]|uniref:GTP pyrophosphokinase n=1 Tax=Arsenicicoccus sp. UBA7492 TaxID=1946057 RepID=UPI00257D8CB1|nr:GTP pyrophosphokinase family protein [Arsenicicoccus sp. UBA7492]